MSDGTEPKYILRTEEPLGREVVLKEPTWVYKISYGRPELTGELTVIQSLVEDPKHILPDLGHTGRQKYVDLVVPPGAQHVQLGVVIVDYSNPVHGEIVSVIYKSKTKQETFEGSPIYERPRNRP